MLDIYPCVNGKDVLACLKNNERPDESTEAD